MTLNTGIEWCDATFNPWWGCEKVSPGCAHCYADTLAKRRAPGQELWGAGHGFRFFPDRHWDEPLRWARTLPAKLGRRPRVFCASMADVFEERPELVPHRVRLYNLILRTPELDWLILTKRPEFARSWLDRHAVCSAVAYAYAHGFEDGDNAWDYAYEAVRTGPKNVWMGVSIENARFTWRADVLREIPAAVRFISAEPLLGSLFDVGTKAYRRSVREASLAVVEGFIEQGMRGDDASAYLYQVESKLPNRSTRPLDLTGIDWCIVGGESGPGARPMRLQWARELVEACRASDVAPFVKQLGARPTYDVTPISRESLRQINVPLKLRDRKGGDWDEWPAADLRVREFPRSAVPAGQPA